MYLLFGATLALMVQQLLMKVSVSRCMQDAVLGTRLVLTHSLFSR